MATEQKNESKTRRISMDLAAPVAAELERMQRATGLKIIDLFRHGITLLRLYINAKIEQKEFWIIDPKRPSDRARIEMPISIHSDTPLT